MIAPGEFELIARWFSPTSRERRGVGDDCALIDTAAGTLALTTDVLVEGVHFLPGADPDALAHKALSVNLSDLAAAGARPRCFLLALILPRADPAWLEPFSRSLLALAERTGCSLVGGDTVRAQPRGAPESRLSIAITAIGEVPPGGGRGRNGARVGDDIWLSGRTGEAALALACLEGRAQLAGPELAVCRERLDRPVARVELGLALNGIATAAIDVSDGLAGDLGHILERSRLGARLEWDAVPVAPAFAGIEAELARSCILSGGDDYELLFVAAPGHRERVLEAGRRAGVGMTRIGVIETGSALQIVDAAGRPIETTLASNDHFL